MYITPDVKSYHLHEFKREEFPIPYDETEFPSGFQHIEVIYGEDGKSKSVSLLGVVDSVMKITGLSDIEKILKFIEESRLLGQKVPHIMNNAIREAVERGKQNPLKPPRIGLPTLEEATAI